MRSSAIVVAMRVALVTLLAWLLPSAAFAANPTIDPGIHEMTFRLPDGGMMLYAVSIPKGYAPNRPSPLVLVLHSGGERMRYYGEAFTKLLVEPALNNLAAVMIAPDCPSASWTDPAADRAVMALVQDALDSYAIDRRRILVTGYSMGGRGTWFMASHHPDVFTAAIPMAGSTADDPLDRLGAMPIYVIHSRDDEVVPFAPAERVAKQLSSAGRNVRFDAVSGMTHFEMFRYVDALRRAARWVADQWKKTP